MKLNLAMKAEPKDWNRSQRSSINQSRNKVINNLKVFKINLKHILIISKKILIRFFYLIKKKKIKSYHYNFKIRVRL